MRSAADLMPATNAPVPSAPVIMPMGPMSALVSELPNFATVADALPIALTNGAMLAVRLTFSDVRFLLMDLAQLQRDGQGRRRPGQGSWRESASFQEARPGRIPTYNMRSNE
jgi:hypothetical protein